VQLTLAVGLVILNVAVYAWVIRRRMRERSAD
jgi:hypothetical protein